MPDTPVEDPQILAEAAALAWRLAPSLCCTASGTRSKCFAAHSAWPSLRMLGILGSIESRADHYREALRALAPQKEVLRVLISGAADHAMLAHVIDACRGTGIRCEITVIDLCETPLAVNRWYAARVSFPVVTARSDIMSFTPPQRFDAICTDSFFGRFPAGRWPALIEQWHNLLQPGGAVITVNALREAGSQEVVRFTEGEACALNEGVLELASAFTRDLVVDPQALAQRAEDYARQHVTHAVRSADEIRALFERGGFTFDKLQIVGPGGSAPHNMSGPSVRGGRQYLHIIARAP